MSANSRNENEPGIRLYLTKPVKVENTAHGNGSGRCEGDPGSLDAAGSSHNTGRVDSGRSHLTPLAGAVFA